MSDTDKILDAIMAIIDRHVDNCNQITLESEIEKVLKSELESTRPVNVDLADINGIVPLETAKKVLFKFDRAIQEQIAIKLEWLRDHGTHAEFCDIITDIRENVLDTYR